MDVMNVEQAKIAEAAGAVAVIWRRIKKIDTAIERRADHAYRLRFGHRLPPGLHPQLPRAETDFRN